jgi:hypothetical protein
MIPEEVLSEFYRPDFPQLRREAPGCLDILEVRAESEELLNRTVLMDLFIESVRAVARDCKVSTNDVMGQLIEEVLVRRDEGELEQWRDDFLDGLLSIHYDTTKRVKVALADISTA